MTRAPAAHQAHPRRRGRTWSSRPPTRSRSCSTRATIRGTTRPASTSASTRTSFAAIAGYAAYFEDSKGRKEPPRAYSMVSTPDEPYLAITIKEELYDKTDEVSAAAVALPRAPPAQGRAHGGDRLRRRLLPARGHRQPHRSPRPPVRRLGQRAERLDDQVGPGAPADGAPHVHLLEQDVERHHLPRPARRARGGASGHGCAWSTR